MLNLTRLTSSYSTSDVCTLPSCTEKKNLNCSENSTPFGRCCIVISGNKTIITEIDLSNCNLKTIDGILANQPNLTTIRLQGNKLKSVKKEDFFHTTNIDLLVLQPNLECPGGPNAWMSYGPDNETETTQCVGEIHTCQLPNVTCPNDNSMCEHVGPNMMECVCIDGYHGYKCLRMGKFPTTVYAIGLAVCTVVLSAVLWLTENQCKKSTPTPGL